MCMSWFRFNKDDLKQMDFEAYVASDGSDDEDDDGEDTAAKYKALVGAIKEEQAANVPEEMEITWNMGLKEKSETLLTKLEKRKAEKNMTLGEKMALKRKEKRKAKKKAAKANGQADKDALVDQDDDTWSDLAKEDAYFREAMAETGDQDKPQNAEDDFAADFDVNKAENLMLASNLQGRFTKRSLDLEVGGASLYYLWHLGFGSLSGWQ
eukprot:TRINITY_DN11331_c0_g2_i7.p1 TRINITY_DN11331_c0_g2~~TRINITY_DN11331_c0_g2_i7.p1  ORF type:complete len:210 (+),score=56.63 TRINITY_DN11331_c0_g2_i7:293-922(+)